MDPILYNAASGGRTGFDRQGVVANNLANVNTTGFRADVYQASTLYATTEDGSNTNGPAFAVQEPSGVDLSQGSIITTGRNLDVAMDSEGWLAVRDKQGKEAYTKAGNLHVDANGLLVTGAGNLVLGNGGPISIPPAQSIGIGSDGTISIVPLGGKSSTMIDRLKLVKLNKTNITKNSEGLLQQKSGGIAPPDASLRVMSGALEGSNVKAIDQMMQMITTGREYETHMQVMSTVNSNSQTLAQLLHE